MADRLEISDKEIKALKIKEKTYSKHFGFGFYVFVRPNRRKVCRYQYQVDGKVKRYNLGEYVPGKGRLKEILKEYRLVQSKRDMDRSYDPVAENDAAARARAIEQAAIDAEAMKLTGQVTLAEAAARFLDRYQGLKGNREPAARTMKDYRSHLEGRILPRFGNYPVAEVPADAIMDWLETLKNSKGEPAPIMANRIFATLSTMYTWIVKKQRGRYGIRRNPFAGMDKPGGVEEAKTRTLDFRPKHKKFDDQGEIRTFWEWLGTINPEHAIALKIILLTGQRPGEVLSAEWEDIFQNEWVLPAEKTKNKKDVHVVPMVPKLAEIFAELRKLTGKKNFLFPARVRSGEPESSVKPSTLSRLIAGARKGAYVDGHKVERDAGALHEIEKFTPHDLRRTMSTYLGGMGYSMSDIGLLLNHSNAVITATYNRADPVHQKIAMLNAWHGRLDDIIEGKSISNVVPLVS